jgi:hypothetical protein
LRILAETLGSPISESRQTLCIEPRLKAMFIFNRTSDGRGVNEIPIRYGRVTFAKTLGLQR